MYDICIHIFVVLINNYQIGRSPMFKVEIILIRIKYVNKQTDKTIGSEQNNKHRSFFF